MVIKLGFFAAVLAAAVYFGSAWIETKLMYHPDTRRIDPREAGLANVEEVMLDTSDGHQVIAWWGRANSGQPTLLYFHGNGGSLVGRSERIAAYLSRGQGVFMMTYRGYGGSTGTPSEARNVADGKRAFDTLVSRGVAASEIIIYGESLGSGVAVQVAAERPGGGIILDAPYTSIVDVGAQAYPFLPARLLMRQRYETMAYIGRVKAPLLIVHGDQDEVIPVEMGRRLFQAAHDPKQLSIIPGAGHTDHADFGSFDVIQAWLSRWRRNATSDG